MDIFNEDNTIEASIDPNKDYLTELVGEGKKYADQRALARAAAEKDLFIKRVLEEKRQLEEDLKTRTNMSDFLDQLKTTVKAPVAAVEVTTPATPSEAKSELPDIEKMIQAKLEEREAANARNRNLLNVKETLIREFGANDYPARVKQRAQELGIPVEWLNDAAAKSPSAFYELMGLNRKSQDQSPRQIPSSVNTASMTSRDTKRFSFYEKMRRENPVEYHSKKVQQEIWEAAKTQGPDFYA